MSTEVTVPAPGTGLDRRPAGTRAEAVGDGAPAADVDVSIDQDLCTGDGLCVQYAPEVFEFDIDGLAYVKNEAGDLLTEPGSRVAVPAHLCQAVIDAATDCPGECIFVHRAGDTAGGDATA